MTSFDRYLMSLVRKISRRKYTREQTICHVCSKVMAPAAEKAIIGGSLVHLDCGRTAKLRNPDFLQYPEMFPLLDFTRSIKSGFPVQIRVP